MNRKVILTFAISILSIYFIVGSYGLYQGASATGSHHILIVNTWNDFPKKNEYNVDAMPAQALYAYTILKEQGYNDSEINLLVYSTDDGLIDFNGDGIDDLSKAIIDSNWIDKENLTAAITRLGNISGQNDEIIIYIISHGQLINGDLPAFSFEKGDHMSSIEFSSLIDSIVCKRMVIYLDFCYSGAFSKSISKPGRLIICSAEDNKEAWFYWNWHLNETERAIFGSSGSAFFHPFWKKLSEGATLNDAFEYGRQQCLRWGFIDTDSRNMTQNQNPQMLNIERNIIDKFIFFFPGGFSVFMILTAFVIFSVMVLMFLFRLTSIY